MDITDTNSMYLPSRYERDLYNTEFQKLRYKWYLFGSRKISVANAIRFSCNDDKQRNRIRDQRF